MTAVDTGTRLVWRLLLVAIVALAGCRHRLAERTDQVRVEVASVGFDRESGVPFVLLEEKVGKRRLPIWIGDNEARAIMFELRGMTPQRPLTSDLLKSVIEKTGNHVDRVVIGDLRDQTYYADIYRDNNHYRIDSRPSDAIALALGLKAPIYVSPKLFESAAAAGAGKPANGPEAAHALGLTVQELSEEIATYFNAKPKSGVLVADVGAAAARAGVERGDVLTRLGDKEIRNLGDFNAGVRALNGFDSVSVTLEHRGQRRAVKLAVPHDPER